MGELVGCGKAIAKEMDEWRKQTVIRINRICEHSTLSLVVEGTLSGVWVDELEKCWVDVRRATSDERVRVDLSGVSFVDDKGRQLLKLMFCQGADLHANGVMTKRIIEEIADDSVSSKGL